MDIVHVDRVHVHRGIYTFNITQRTLQCLGQNSVYVMSFVSACPLLE